MKEHKLSDISGRLHASITIDDRETSTVGSGVKRIAVALCNESSIWHRDIRGVRIIAGLSETGSSEHLGL